MAGKLNELKEKVKGTADKAKAVAASTKSTGDKIKPTTTKKSSAGAGTVKKVSPASDTSDSGSSSSGTGSTASWIKFVSNLSGSGSTGSTTSPTDHIDKHRTDPNSGSLSVVAGTVGATAGTKSPNHGKNSKKESVANFRKNVPYWRDAIASVEPFVGTFGRDRTGAPNLMGSTPSNRFDKLDEVLGLIENGKELEGLDKEYIEAITEKFGTWDNPKSPKMSDTNRYLAYLYDKGHTVSDTLDRMGKGGDVKPGIIDGKDGKTGVIGPGLARLMNDDINGMGVLKPGYAEAEQANFEAKYTDLSIQIEDAMKRGDYRTAATLISQRDRLPLNSPVNRGIGTITTETSDKISMADAYGAGVSGDTLDRAIEDAERELAEIDRTGASRERMVDAAMSIAGGDVESVDDDQIDGIYDIAMTVLGMDATAATTEEKRDAIAIMQASGTGFGSIVQEYFESGRYGVEDDLHKARLEAAQGKVDRLKEQKEAETLNRDTDKLIADGNLTDDEYHPVEDFLDIKKGGGRRADVVYATVNGDSPLAKADPTDPDSMAAISHLDTDDIGKYTYMTPDEREKFNKLYNGGMIDEAMRWADSLGLDARRASGTTMAETAWATEHPGEAIISNLVASVVDTPANIYRLGAEALSGGQRGSYDPLYDDQRMKAAYWSGVTNAIGSNYDNLPGVIKGFGNWLGGFTGKSGAEAYTDLLQNVTANAERNGIAAAVGTALTAATGIPGLGEALGLIMMGIDTAATGIYQNSE